MTYEFSFEKLEVWKKSVDFTKSIYLHSSTFPESEKFGLTNQFKRASVSIASNLAEETSRNKNKDKAHFTTMAFNSLMEVLNQLIISKELNFISEEKYEKLRIEIGKTPQMLNAL
jgi:four helix bundle protein